MPDRSKGWHRYLFMREIEWQRKNRLFIIVPNVGQSLLNGRDNAPAVVPGIRWKKLRSRKRRQEKKKLSCRRNWQNLPKCARLRRKIHRVSKPAFRNLTVSLAEELSPALSCWLVEIRESENRRFCCKCASICRTNRKKFFMYPARNRCSRSNSVGTVSANFRNLFFFWQRPILRQSKGRSISCSRKWRLLTRFRPCMMMRSMRHREA